MKQLIVVVLIAAACGGNKQKTAPANTVQASAVLTLGPAKLAATVDGKPMELALDASGKVVANGDNVAILSSSGEVRDAKGTVVATIAADGRVTIANEPKEDILIRDDGTVVNRGEVLIEINADGVLEGLLVTVEKINIVFTGAPETRRAIMLAWLSTTKGLGKEPAKSATTP